LSQKLFLVPGKDLKKIYPFASYGWKTAGTVLTLYGEIQAIKNPAYLMNQGWAGS
jgi:hypothetical protein